MNDYENYALLLRLYITLGKNVRRTAWYRESEKSHGEAEREDPCEGEVICSHPEGLAKHYAASTWGRSGRLSGAKGLPI